jgi:hypothetical protein
VVPVIRGNSMVCYVVGPCGGENCFGIDLQEQFDWEARAMLEKNPVLSVDVGRKSPVL